MIADRRTRLAILISVLYELVAFLLVNWLFSTFNIHSPGFGGAMTVATSFLLLVPGSFVALILLWAIPSWADWTFVPLVIAMAVINVVVLTYLLRKYWLTSTADSSAAA